MSRADISAEIADLVQEGKVRDAYSKFEELPLLDQVGISISPGVGDALAAYETYEFSTRAKEKIKEGDILGGAGYGALTGLTAASLIPLFRLLRGVRPTTKAIPKDTIQAPVAQPADLPKPKKIEVPKLDKDRPLTELTYPNTGNFTIGDPIDDATGLVSTVRKELYTGNYPDQMKMNSLLNKLKNKVPNNELRALDVLNPDGTLHKDFVKRFGSIENKINVKGLDNYLEEKQLDYFKFEIDPNKSVDQGTLSGYGLGNKQEASYRVKGLDAKKEMGDAHFNQYYDDVLVFDGSTDIDFLTLESNMRDALADTLAQSRDYVKYNFYGDPTRLIKSDVTNKMRRKVKDYKVADLDKELAKHFDAVVPGKPFKVPDRKADGGFRVIFKNPLEQHDLGETHHDYVRGLKEILPNLDSENFLKMMKAESRDLNDSIRGIKESLVAPGRTVEELSDKDLVVKNLNRIQSDYAEGIAKVRKRKDIDTAYKDPKAAKELGDTFNEFNKEVTEFNKKPRSIFRYDDVNDRLFDEPEFVIKAKNKIDPFIKDGYNITYGIPNAAKIKGTLTDFLKESYQKYADDFYQGRVKGSFLKYIKKSSDLAKNKHLQVGDDVFVKPLSSFEYPPYLFDVDDFAVRNRPVVTKIVTRARVNDAVRRNYGGIYIDGPQKVVSREGGGRDANFIVQSQYVEAANELKKIVREMGGNSDDVKFIYDIRNVDDNLPKTISGAHYIFTDEFINAVKKKGINAFKNGGPVSIQESLNELNKVILPIDISSDVGSIQPVEESISAKDVTDIIFDPTDPVDYAILGAGPLGKFALSANKTRKLIDKVLSLKQRGRQAAAKELIDSDDLKLFKEFEVMPIKNRLGAYYDLGAAKFGGVKMRVPKDTPYAIRLNNLRTGKPYTAKEIDDIAYSKAGDRLSYLFKTLEEGGNSARKVIKQHPEVAALYKKSGREIPTVALRPDQLKEYIKGEAKGLNTGGLVSIDSMLAAL